MKKAFNLSLLFLCFTLSPHISLGTEKSSSEESYPFTRKEPNIPNWKATESEAITVAVIDTGLDFTHPLLRNKLWFNHNPHSEFRIGYDFADNDSNPFDFIRNPTQTISDMKNNAGLFDKDYVEIAEDFPINLVLTIAATNGHGTHVSSLVARSSPNARIMGLRADALYENFWLAAALAFEAAIANGADVVNFSAGTHALEVSDDEKSSMEFIANIIADNPQVIFVVGAGNSANDMDDTAGSDYFPANLNAPNLVTVGSVSHELELSTFSNVGASVDVYTYGENILGAWPGGKIVPSTGTSMAAPIVAGAIANELEKANGQSAVETLNVFLKSLKLQKLTFINETKLSNGDTLKNTSEFRARVYTPKEFRHSPAKD